MNPLFHWIVSHSTMKALARTCAKCGEKQLVARHQRKQTLPCKKCRAPLPPPRAGK